MARSTILHALASINGLPKEEGTLYMMWNRFPYISLIDEDAHVNLKRGRRIDILAGQISRILLAF